MYAIRSYYDSRRGGFESGEGSDISRITSYNVCYTKLLRAEGGAADEEDAGEEAEGQRVAPLLAVEARGHEGPEPGRHGRPSGCGPRVSLLRRMAAILRFV